ncbi:MAG: pitrilysin family protein [Pirellulaceae bacterium]
MALETLGDSSRTWSTWEWKRQRSASVAHLSFGGAMPAEHLLETLPIYRDVLLAPHLPEEQFEDSVRVCQQELAAVEDDLAQLTMQALKRVHFPDPLSRTSLGQDEHLTTLTMDDVRNHLKTRFHPQGTILAVAGQFDWSRVRDLVGELFGDWRTPPGPSYELRTGAGGYEHLSHESHQAHIAVAFPTVPYRHPDYFQARGAVGVLSDGLSSRLFREVREVRGLCYTVGASLYSYREVAGVVTYSGTSMERAQETLDVILEQLRALRSGITQAELNRLKVHIQSNLVMQQESSRARAAAIAGDWYHLQATRSLEEVQQRVEGLTVASINEFLERQPLDAFDVVTLGPQPLEVRE